MADNCWVGFVWVLGFGWVKPYHTPEASRWSSHPARGTWTFLVIPLYICCCMSERGATSWMPLLNKGTSPTLYTFSGWNREWHITMVAASVWDEEWFYCCSYQEPEWCDKKRTARAEEQRGECLNWQITELIEGFKYRTAALLDYHYRTRVLRLSLTANTQSPYRLRHRWLHN